MYEDGELAAGSVLLGASVTTTRTTQTRDEQRTAANVNQAQWIVGMMQIVALLSPKWVRECKKGEL